MDFNKIISGIGSVAGPFGAIASGVGGLLGSIFSSNSANKQLKAQQQENALNRQFNADQAKLNREFQVEMFDRQNAYNDPKAIVTRLQSAGINPAVALGSINQGSASASSGSSASFGGGVSPTLPDFSGLMAPGNSLQNLSVQQAQARLLNSEAAKNEAEIPYVERLQNMSLRLFDSQYWLNKSTQYFNEQQAESVFKSLTLLDKQITNMDFQNAISEESYKQAISQTNIKNMESRYAASYYCGQARQLHSIADLNDGQLMKLGATLYHEIALLDANVRRANSESESYELNNAFTRAVQQCKGLGVLSEAEVRRILAETENTVKEQFNRQADRDNSKDVAWIHATSQGFSSLLDLGEMLYNNSQRNRRNSNSLRISRISGFGSRPI